LHAGLVKNTLQGSDPQSNNKPYLQIRPFKTFLEQTNSHNSHNAQGINAFHTIYCTARFRIHNT